MRKHNSLSVDGRSIFGSGPDSLTPEFKSEEARLWGLYKNGKVQEKEEAERCLAELYYPMFLTACNYASNKNTIFTQEDVEGFCGIVFLRTIRYFDPNRGIKFRTYLIEAVNNQIGREIKTRKRRKDYGRVVSFESQHCRENLPDLLYKQSIEIESEFTDLWSIVCKMITPKEKVFLHLKVKHNWNISEAGRIMGLTKQRAFQLSDGVIEKCSGLIQSWNNGENLGIEMAESTKKRARSMPRHCCGGVYLERGEVRCEEKIFKRGVCEEHFRLALDNKKKKVKVSVEKANEAIVKLDSISESMNSIEAEVSGVLAEPIPDIAA